MEQLSFDHTIASFKSRGAILCIPSVLIEEWFSFGILRLPDGMDVNPVLAFVEIERLCKIDWLTLGEQNGFSLDLDDSMLVMLKDAEPVKRVLPDRTEKWRNGTEEVYPIHNNEYEFRGVMQKFAKVAWLCYTDIGESFCDLQSLEAQNELLNQRQKPARLVDFEINANVASTVG